MKVLRIYHAGRDGAHRERDRALVRAGAELTLVVPAQWPGPDDGTADEPFDVVELDVRRPDDVNRHRYADPAALAAVIRRVAPDVLDLHEEPFSAVTHQVLDLVAPGQPVVAYAAQNLDKRFPPPFSRWERLALTRLDALYPCSRQAASVAVGKGFRGPVRVLPLGVTSAYRPGDQQPGDEPIRLLHVGRLVPEKGVLDSVRLAAQLSKGWPVTLTVVGEGPDLGPAQGLATALDTPVEFLPWLPADDLIELYRRAHVLLAPSRTSPTWAEQFGRMVVEAQACGAVVAGYASGSLPEVVGGSGVLVAAGDGAALTGAVATLLTDHDRWRSLRDEGLGRTSGRRWDAVAEGQLALYRDAVARADVLDGSRGRAARPQRRLARDRFGVTGSSLRTFALPVLRDAPTGVGRAADLLARRDRSRPDGPLRVVYLDHVARLSGGEIALVRLIEALPDVEAHVILAEDGPLRERLVSAGARVEVLELDEAVRDARRSSLASSAGGAAALTAYTLRLASRLRALAPDLVHTNSLKSGYYGVAAARLAGVPVLWHLRDRLADDYLPSAAARATRVALRRADLVVANSAVSLATAGAGVVVADPYRRGAPPARSSSDVPTVGAGVGLIVGLVGRIAPWKGQDVLLRAAASVPDASFVVAGAPQFGEDAHLADLRALASDLGVADRVEFRGHVDDVEALLDGLDVLVHASTLTEPFGQVVVEGMAAGLAVVAADAGGPREIVTDGVDGLLVAPGDPRALAEALERLRDPALRARLGAAARVRAAAFAPDVVGPRMRTVYRSLTGR